MPKREFQTSLTPALLPWVPMSDSVLTPQTPCSNCALVSLAPLEPFRLAHPTYPPSGLPSSSFTHSPGYSSRVGSGKKATGIGQALCALARVATALVATVPVVGTTALLEKALSACSSHRPI